MYIYVLINGQRVEWNVAEAFRRMAADFQRDTKHTLQILSGTRTTAEQERIFRARYRVQHTGGGRFNDVRWWLGQRWVRHSAAGTVAVPGRSNHEEGGPNGPRSIDIYDSGDDAGVTVRGSTRDLWMQRNASKYGFENEGYGFNEPWHKTFRGSIGGKPSPAGAISHTSIKDEEMAEPSFVYNASPYDRVYAINPFTGRKRGLSKAEWEAQKLKGAKAWAATKAQVDEIPSE